MHYTCGMLASRWVTVGFLIAGCWTASSEAPRAVKHPLTQSQLTKPAIPARSEIPTRADAAARSETPATSAAPRGSKAWVLRELENREIEIRLAMGLPAVPPPPRPALDPTTIPATITSETRSAMVALDATTVFALEGVGITGQPSPGKQLTDHIMLRPDAEDALDWLVTHARPAAQLYAYWALGTIAPSRATVHAMAMENDNTEVDTASGCSVWTTTVATLMASMSRP